MGIPFEAATFTVTCKVCGSEAHFEYRDNGYKYGEYSEWVVIVCSRCDREERPIY